MTTIGNITKVRWHYKLDKISQGTYGHRQESYIPEEYYIVKPHPILKDSKIYKCNDTMVTDKNYAYVIVENKQILIRNLFNNKDPKGFCQKNHFFKDDCSGIFSLEDTNNILLEYLKLGNSEITELIPKSELYFCVEYELYNCINQGLFEYMIDISIKNKVLEKKIYEIESKIKLIDSQITWF
jgi:hypothetical protein